MIDFFASLYASVGNKYSLLRQIKFYTFLRLGISVLYNMLIPIMMRVTSSKKDFSLVCQNSGREK